MGDLRAATRDFKATSLVEASRKVYCKARWGGNGPDVAPADLPDYNSAVRSPLS